VWSCGVAGSAQLSRIKRDHVQIAAHLDVSLVVDSLGNGAPARCPRPKRRIYFGQIMVTRLGVRVDMRLGKRIPYAAA